ncbi:hypothetical protein ACF07T_19020 [Streptomyces sp. NPDC015184]|uniref:hypothetical protein n=1 Tax=Streptomyces sp. NPDC015184 TaxID=3364946 RepID=UPI0036FBDA3A
MTEPKTFQTHLRQASIGILERMPEELRAVTYVLAFNVWRIDGDDRRSFVDIGYNTESRYEEEARKDGADPHEVRWNYAFWLLDGFDRLGNVPEDPAGGMLYEEETRRLGLWHDGEFDLHRLLDDDELAAKADLLQLHFHDAVIDLVRHLHASGAVERIFGRPLPVVVFDMDHPGWEEEATRAANPPELIGDFLAWCG